MLVFASVVHEGKRNEILADEAKLICLIIFWDTCHQLKLCATKCQYHIRSKLSCQEVAIELLVYIITNINKLMIDK